MASATDTRAASNGTVTALPNGSQVVVWSYLVTSGQYATCFRIIDGLGRPGAIQTVTTTGTSDTPSEVTVLKDGSFVITWSTASTATTPTSIKAQKFSITGIPDQAGPVTLAEPTAGLKNDFPDVAANGLRGEGHWVAVWAETNDTDTDHIWFRRSTGEKISVWAAIADRQSQNGVNKPAVTEVANGKHVVTWVQSGKVKVALVDANDTVSALEDAFASTSASADYPSITALSTGGFVISWFTSRGTSSGNEYYISTQAYSVEGNKIGSGIEVKIGKGANESTDITALTKGGFAGGYALVYSDDLDDGTDTDPNNDTDDIYLRLVKANGDLVEKVINDGTLRPGAQTISSVTELADGRISVVWQSGAENPARVYTQIIDAREIAVTVQGTRHNDIYVGTSLTNITAGDVLKAYDGNDSLYGGGNDDTLFGGIGADYLDGGLGDDWADYSEAASTGDTKGLVISLRLTANNTPMDANTGEAAGDTYSGIEKLRGSAFQDILLGNGDRNTLEGGGEYDKLYGGAGVVADHLDGGAGWDAATYEYSTAGVGIVLNLKDEQNSQGEARGDTFKDIESFVGTAWGDMMIGRDIVKDGETIHDEFFGASGDDTLLGFSGDDYLNGGQDNDMLMGGDGNDRLIGGEKDDTLMGGHGSDTLDGGSGFNFVSYEDSSGGVIINLWGNLDGSDVALDYIDASGVNHGRSIQGVIGSGTFSDPLTGDGRANELRGLAGNDRLWGEINSATVFSSDTLEGGSGSDTLHGGGGVGVVDFASYANATLINGKGVFVSLNPADRTRFTNEAEGDELNGIEGLIGSAYADTLIGDAGDNVLRGGGANDTLEGGDGSDRLEGGSGNDVLTDGAGADRLEGGAGDDTYYVDASDTIVEGAGQGIDTVVVTTDFTLSPGAVIENIVLSTTATVRLLGNEQDNVLTGNTGANILDGQAGNDLIVGGAGADTMTGSFGNDTLYVDDAGDVVVEHAGQGLDTVMVNTAAYVLGAGAEVETLMAGVGALNITGSDFANAISGNSLNNQLWGKAGNDVLTGIVGNDRLYGGTGNDRLSGGVGNDQLKGETGRDVFVFDTRTNKSTNVDKVLDFKSADDSFHLDNAIFTKLGRGSAAGVRFKNDMFVEGSRAKDREDRIVYDKKTGSLYYDQDGTGSKAQVKIATISNKTKLYYHDFFVI